MRELYSRREQLSGGKQTKIEDRWNMVNRKLNRSNHMLADELYYCFEEQFIMDKAKDELEVKNMHYLKSHYSDFKGTTGYEFILSTDRGSVALDNIESAIEQNNVMVTGSR